MAQIMNVDYEAMPNQAKQMREYAKELNSTLKVEGVKFYIKSSLFKCARNAQFMVWNEI